MIKLENWISIKNLKLKDPSLGTRQIAKLLRLSRNTVKKALQSDPPPEYKMESIINRHIAPFKDYIPNISLKIIHYINNEFFCKIYFNFLF